MRTTLLPPAVFVGVAIVCTTPACSRVRGWIEPDTTPGPDAVALPATPTPTGRRRTRPSPRLVPAVGVRLLPGAISGRPPPGAGSLLDLLARLRTHLSVDEGREVAAHLSRSTLARFDALPSDPVIAPIVPMRLARILAGEVRRLRYDGRNAVIDFVGGGAVRPVRFLFERRAWRLDLRPPQGPVRPGPRADEHTEARSERAEAAGRWPGVPADRRETRAGRNNRGPGAPKPPAHKDTPKGQAPGS